MDEKINMVLDTMRMMTRDNDGVVIEPQTMRVDQTATDRLRAAGSG